MKQRRWKLEALVFKFMTNVTNILTQDNKISEEQSTILQRASPRNSPVGNETICIHHLLKFTSAFERIFDKCCNPFDKHVKCKVKS